MVNHRQESQAIKNGESQARIISVYGWLFSFNK
jgi:hypothetical protein